MIFRKNHRFPLLPSLFFVMIGLSSGAQNINGEKIQVAANALTVIKFNSEINRYELGDRTGYTCQIRHNDNSIVIKTTGDDAANTNLVVTEGKRTHYFVILFQKEIDINKIKLFYDYSDLKELRKIVKASESNPPPTEPTGKDDNKIASNKEPDTDNAIKENKVSKADKKRLEKQAELDDTYNDALNKGDKAFAAKSFDQAKAAYNEALGLKPNEQYPKDKIAAVDKAISDRNSENARAAAENERMEKEKALDDKYNIAIAKADKALASRLYDEAKGGYYEALRLKPNEQYPKDKIASIDNLLAASAAEAAAEKEKIAKENEQKQKYDAAIAKGDKAYDERSYDQAKSGYYEALGLKPGEQYPKDRLSQIDKLLGDAATESTKAAAEKERIAKEKALNEKYNAAISKADKALASKSYDAAKAGYYEALGLKPNEQYPNNKIKEINKVLADLAAENLAEKNRITKENELNAKYAAVLNKADMAYTAKKYDAARTAYNEAVALKPNEQYPKDRLTAIQKAMDDQSAENARATAERERIAKEKMLNDKYNSAIARADRAYVSKSYEAAKSSYYEALGLKPSEQYPKDRLLAIDNILATIAAEKQRVAAEKERIAKEKELNEKYKTAITKGDKAFAAKNYDSAKAGYYEAMGLKPEEEYPKTKLAALDKILEDIAAKEREARDPHQKSFIPYTQAELFKKYPNINFYNPPDGQKLAADYFFEADTLENYKVGTQILASTRAHRLNFTAMDNEAKVSLDLQDINFSGANTYLTLRIQNHSSEDFLTGTMLLTWYKKDGTLQKLWACYIPAFPVVKPGKEVTMVYAARAVNASDEDKFVFEMNDRYRKANLEIEFPAKTYNTELNREQTIITSAENATATPKQ